jgi:CheY-like chemotaxis protein
MQTKALLVSDDLLLRSEIKPVLNEAGIACECCELAGFDRVIARGKVECILLDIADPVKFSEVITKLRAEKFNRYAIVLALAEDAHRTVLSKISGVNFFVSKSAQLVPNLRQALSSARALIIYEKRRYYRHPVDLIAEVFCHGQVTRAKMIDLSARGACLDCNGLRGINTLRLTFVLPGSNQRLEVNAIMAWTKGTNVGVEFTSLSNDSDKALKAWLREKEAASSAVSL